ncbi:sulfatase-like hydrolase/transferase [Lysobacter sp. F6437]|uniref:sulfatase-like hydrolase/transferase n=1 Tax=Lysobacter sp. F6437 TaxID=3459296 RepID=UPI00403DD1C9
MESTRGTTANVALPAIKALLLGAFMLGINPLLRERIADIGLQPALLVFLAIWVLAGMALLALAFLARPLARVCWSVLIFCAGTAHLAHVGITGRALGLLDFEQLLGLVGFAGNLAGFHAAPILSALAWSLLGVVAINMPPFLLQDRPAHGWRKWMGYAPGLLQCVPVLAIAAIVHVRGGEGSNGMPGQYTAPAFSVVLAAEQATAQGPEPRRPVTLVPEGLASPLRHIAVVIDESVHGRFLDLNSDDGVDTGLQSAAGVVSNFGIASSIANCSTTSNASMRFGVGRDDYLRDLQVQPSIWQYARRAGYRTVYIDAQRHGGRLQNLMTPEETRDIDAFVQLDRTTPIAQRDVRAGRRLREALSRAEPSFILVNKMGCHFPYEGKYPAGQARYSPTMARTYFGNEGDPDIALATIGGDRQRMLNSYRNCLDWNTRRFFDEVLPSLPLDDVLIVYTADHGQNFHEEGEPRRQTHCTIGPADADEGTVPLATITGHPGLARRLGEAARRNHDKASLFNLHPTLLWLMGFPRDQLTPARGFEPDLLSTLDAEGQRFLSTYFVRFGRAPVWNSIGPDGSQPPRSTASAPAVTGGRADAATR